MCRCLYLVRSINYLTIHSVHHNVTFSCKFTRRYLFDYYIFNSRPYNMANNSSKTMASCFNIWQHIADGCCIVRLRWKTCVWISMVDIFYYNLSIQMTIYFAHLGVYILQRKNSDCNCKLRYVTEAKSYSMILISINFGNGRLFYIILDKFRQLWFPLSHNQLSNHTQCTPQCNVLL